MGRWSARVGMWAVVAACGAAPPEPAPTTPVAAVEASPAVEAAPSAAPAPEAATPADEEEASDRPLARAPDRLFACDKDNDCVIACDFPGGCCNDSCGCDTAVNGLVLTELREKPWAPCSDACPTVACAKEDTFGVHCEEGRCQAGPRRPPGSRAGP